MGLEESGEANVGRLIKRRSLYSFVIGHIDDMNDDERAVALTSTSTPGEMEKTNLQREMEMSLTKLGEIWLTLSTAPPPT